LDPDYLATPAERGGRTGLRQCPCVTTPP
jgi:hypothetical protein